MTYFGEATTETIELLERRQRPRWSPPSPEEIKGIRKKLRLTQAEFAEKFRIDLTTLRNWEQGRRHPEHCNPPLSTALPRAVGL